MTNEPAPDGRAALLEETVRLLYAENLQLRRRLVLVTAAARAALELLEERKGG